VIAPMNSYITSVRGDWSIGRALTFSSGFYNLGAVLGPISGGFIADLLGLKTVYLIAAIIFVISTVIVLFASKAPETHHADQGTAISMGILKNPRFFAFLAVTLLSIFAIYLPQPFTPSFLQNQHEFSRSMIGIFGAIGSLCHPCPGKFALGHRLYHRSGLGAGLFTYISFRPRAFLVRLRVFFHRRLQAVPVHGARHVPNPG